MPRLLKNLFVVTLGLIPLILSGYPISAARFANYDLRLATGDRVVEPASAADFFRDLPLAPYPERGAVIQFYELPDDAARTALEASGIRLHQYLPDMAFIASIPRSVSQTDLAGTGMRWVGTLRPEDKIAEALKLFGTPDWSRDRNGLGRFTVQTYGHILGVDAAAWLEAEYGAVILAASEISSVVDVALPAENWYDIAQDERVMWIEPFMVRREANNSNRVNTHADAAQAPPYNLGGLSVMVGEWDGGRVDNTHPDLGQVLTADNSAISTHATHVAGTVVGSGQQSGGTYKGMAPNAQLLSHQWWNSSAELESEYQAAIIDHDMDLTTNSWIVGYDPSNTSACNAFLGNYFSSCETVDNAVRGSLGQSVTVCWAASNERSTGSTSCGSLGFTWGTIAPYGTSKNTLTVGAINSNNSTMTSFSGWGPTDDGRLKPEVVAPGCQTSDDWGVTSTTPGGGYSAFCGTSMATPTAAGCVALWLQQYKMLYLGTPLASTIKVAFCQTANDLGDPGPEYDFGFGAIDVTAAVDLVQAGAFLEDQLADGDTLSWTFAIDGSISDIMFTMAWDDPGAAPNANPTLVNDLELRLVSPLPAPATYLPLVLDPNNPAANATPGEDHTNNIEQVRRNVAGQNGLWTVMVIGHSVPTGPQKFSLAYTPGLSLSSGQQQYAGSLTAGNDLTVTAGDHPLEFRMLNLGALDDTYDLVLTSARGWTITPGATSLAVASQTEGVVNPVLTVPGSATFGMADTIIGTMTSQADPGVTDTDTTIVFIDAVFGLTITGLADTAGVPGRSIGFPVTITNDGSLQDTFDWTATDIGGWTLVPAVGSVTLPFGGDSTFEIAVTIPAGMSPGAFNQITVTAASQNDPGKTGNTVTQVAVINFPPLPLSVSPAAGTITGDPQPPLVWTHTPYAPPPPGFDVFTYALEIGADTNLSVGVTRYDALTDTSWNPPSPFADGPNFWRVITYNTVGDSSGFSAPARFDVDTQRPDPPLLLTPAYASYSSDSTPAFTWGPVTSTLRIASGAMLYHWELSFDSVFTAIADSATTALLTHQVPLSNALPTCSTVVWWRVTATDPAGNISDPSSPNRFEIFRRGDMNFDCEIDAVDLGLLIDYIFFSAPPPVPSDRGELNCTTEIDALDLAFIIDYIFFNGPVPCGPE